MDEQAYYFDEEAADRVCRFFETQLVHFKGQHAGTAFELLPWQRQVLRDLFGWKKHSDGSRRYRTAYIEVPRKNGKTFFVSGILLYMLCADAERGAEVYAVACNREQSGIALKNTHAMVEASAALTKRLKTNRYGITHEKSRSEFKALSGESIGSHGKNIHCLAVDELHEWKSEGSRDLFEALCTSMGSRHQPLTVMITTAGHGGEETLCLEWHNRAMKYQRGDVKPGDAAYDATFYPLVFGAEKDEPWDDPQTWRKANPSLGQTPTEDYLAAECVKAKADPRVENSFRRLYLNQWTEQATRWLSLDIWDRSASAAIDAAAIDKAPCIVGLDLSQIYDLSAAVSLYLTPDAWRAVPRLYIPRETAQKRWHEDGTPFPEWIEQGHVIATDAPGGTLDIDRIENDLVEQSRREQLIEVAFDRYNAGATVARLDKVGIVAVEVKQTWQDMSPACKELERRLSARKILIAPNAALRWMAANVEIRQDEKGNILPVKPKRKGTYAGTAKYSIDGIVALIMSINRGLVRAGGGEQTFDIANAIAFA